MDSANGLVEKTGVIHAFGRLDSPPGTTMSICGRFDLEDLRIEISPTDKEVSCGVCNRNTRLGWTGRKSKRSRKTHQA